MARGRDSWPEFSPGAVVKPYEISSTKPLARLLWSFLFPSPVRDRAFPSVGVYTRGFV